MIVLQTTTAQWYKAVQTDPNQTPNQFFSTLRTTEAADRTASKSTWVEVAPIEGLSAFGPDLDRAWVKLEHVAVFGLVSA